MLQKYSYQLFVFVLLTNLSDHSFVLLFSSCFLFLKEERANTMELELSFPLSFFPNLFLVFKATLFKSLLFVASTVSIFSFCEERLYLFELALVWDWALIKQKSLAKVSSKCNYLFCNKFQWFLKA